jgi:FixJ family two-component response regulator
MTSRPLESTQPAWIVDDDAHVRAALAGFLGVLGIATQSFDSCEAFLAASGADETGLLFVDLKMMGMSGLELIEELQRRKSRLKTVLMTGACSDECAARARSGGALTVLEKPFSIKSLKRVLDEQHHAGGGSSD